MEYSPSWEADSRSAGITAMKIDLNNWNQLNRLRELIRKIHIDFIHSNLGVYRIFIDMLWINLIEMSAHK
jgi:hypothetical protein